MELPRSRRIRPGVTEGMRVVAVLVLITCICHLVHTLIDQYYFRRQCDRCLGIGGWFGPRGWIACNECDEEGYRWEKRTRD
jgi:hypothetical protein